MKLDIVTINDRMRCLTELKYKNLLDVVDHLSNGDYRLKPNIIPNSEAVYAFLMDGNIK